MKQVDSKLGNSSLKLMVTKSKVSYKNAYIFGQYMDFFNFGLRFWDLGYKYEVR